MQIIISILNFFQDQVLGMKWLNAVIGSGLSAVGLDLESQGWRKYSVFHLRYN